MPHAPRLCRELLRLLLRARDQHVVEEHAVVHRPQLEADGADGRERLPRRRVLEMLGVWDLPRLPLAFVRRVLDARRVPLALVLRVGHHWRAPLATAGVRAFRVGHERRLPLAVLLLVPVRRHARLWIGDFERLVVVPVCRLDRVRVRDLEGRVLVPVVGLARIRVIHHGLVHPVLRLHVSRVVDLLGRDDRRLKVLQQREVDWLGVVDGDAQLVVAEQREAVEVGEHGRVRRRRRQRRAARQVVLHPLATDWILELEDEMHLARPATLVRPKHDRVGRGLLKLGEVKACIHVQQLHVRAAALEPVLERDLVLHHERLLGERCR
mmetsp:Transcript_24073/g.62027  ORF Transcript_24073/g.62027 Transcript_24073/m.62027 type:complete len:324 (-) Transcript_24073:156-1127(-)